MDAIIWQMIADGATLFTEVGPGKVLAGLIAKIDREATAACVIVFSLRFCIQFHIQH
jgi:malonyl CoA-acyl carrier protein transacylase